jgi:hypothetical protein
MKNKLDKFEQSIEDNAEKFVPLSDAEKNEVVAFDPKTALIPHYEKTLGAVLISERRMVIFEEKAKLLIDKYFPETEV